MSEYLKKDKIILILLFAFLILHTFWIFELRILPFVDVPLHLSAAVIKENLHQAGNEFHKYYDMPLSFQSNLFHLYFVTLFRDIEFGNKMFYTLYYFLMVFMIYIFIRKIGGETWFSLFSFLVIYNYNLLWGFTGYTISLPFVLLFCFILIFYYDHSLISEILLSILTLFIFIIHFQSALFCALLFFVYIVYSFIDHKIFNIKGFLVVIIPFSVLFIYTYSLNTTVHDIPLYDYLYNYYTGPFFKDLHMRLVNLVIMDNYFISKIIILSNIWAVFIFLSLTGALLLTYVKKENRIKPVIELRELILFTAVVLICFMILPEDIPGQSMIYTRFAVYFTLFSLIIGSYVLPSKLRTNKLKLIISGVLIIHYLVIAHYFYGYKLETDDFTQAILPPSGTKEVTSALVYDGYYRDMPSFIHLPLYNLIWNKNVTTGLVDYRFFVIKRKTDMKVFPSYNAWVGLRNDYSGEYDHLKYILVKGELKHYLPNFEVIKESGKWRLYENKKFEEIE